MLLEGERSADCRSPVLIIITRRDLPLPCLHQCLNLQHAYKILCISGGGLIVLFLFPPPFLCFSHTAADTILVSPTKKCRTTSQTWSFSPSCGSTS